MTLLTSILSIFSVTGKGLKNTDLSPDELIEKITKGEAYLIDVRSPGEYKGGYIKGAGNIDVMAGDFLNKATKLSKSKPVFVYCQSGIRSGNAASKLRNIGFESVTNLGGIGGLKKAGLSMA